MFELSYCLAVLGLGQVIVILLGDWFTGFEGIFVYSFECCLTTQSHMEKW